MPIREHFLGRLLSSVSKIAVASSGSARKGKRRTLIPVAAEVATLEPRVVPTVTFHGGAVLSHVAVQDVYLGEAWTTNATAKSQVAQLEGFGKSIVASSYFDSLASAGYGVGRGTASVGYVDPLKLTTTGLVTTTQIEAELQKQITAGKLQTPDANRLYVVYMAPGVAVKASDGSTTINNWLGIHGAFFGHTSAGRAADIRYAIVAYPGGRNPSSASQGFANSLDELTSVASHEIAEAATDPDVNYKQLGWYDDAANGEIGDVQAFGYQRPTYVRIGGYLFQEVVDKSGHLLVPGSAPPIQTLGTPTSVAATISSPGTVNLSWNAASNASGYNIYWWNGQKAILLGSVSSNVSSVNISGAPHGLNSFLVQAFNGSNTTNSPWVSVSV